MKLGHLPLQGRVFFLVCCLLSLCVLWPLGVPLGAGAAMGFVCESLVARGTSRVRYSRRSWASWLIASALSLALWALVIIPVFFSLGRALQDLLDISKTLDWHALGERIDVFLRQGVSWLSTFGVHISAQQLLSRISSLMRIFSEKALNDLGSWLSQTPQLIFNLAIFQLSWIVFMVKGRAYRASLIPILIPFHEVRILLNKVTADVIRGVITANIAVSLVQTALITVLLFAFGVPRALVWGSLAFFLSFVPLIGTAPVLVGGSVYLFTHDSPVLGICLLASVLIVGTIDNFLRPLFLKGSVELPFFWVLISFLGGVMTFGFAGVIIGPLAFALFAAVMRDLKSR